MEIPEARRTNAALCACLDSLFGGRDDRESLGVAYRAGLRAFEIWDWRGRDLDAFHTARNEWGMRMVLLSGNSLDEPLVASDRGAAVRQVRASIEIARELGCAFVAAHAGYRSGDDDDDRANLLAALGDLAPAAEDAGVMLTLEPLNTRVDHPGYFLRTVPQAAAVVDEVPSTAVGITYDLYHQQVQGGSLVATFEAHRGVIQHLHLAGVPGRKDPTAGEINAPFVIQAIRRRGYLGAVGLEYWPDGDPGPSLSAVAEYLKPALG